MSANSLQATPSPLQLRDELETMFLKELLGHGSEEEEIIEPPGTRYLIGVLAPRRRAARDVERATPRIPGKDPVTSVRPDDE